MMFPKRDMELSKRVLKHQLIGLRIISMIPPVGSQNRVTK